MEAGAIFQNVVTGEGKANGRDIDYGIGYGIKLGFGKGFGLNVTRTVNTVSFSTLSFNPGLYTPEQPGTSPIVIPGSPSSYYPEQIHYVGSRNNRCIASVTPSGYTAETPTTVIDGTPGVPSQNVPASASMGNETHDIVVYQIMPTYEAPIGEGFSMIIGIGQNIAKMDGETNNAMVLDGGLKVTKKLKGFDLSLQADYVYNQPMDNINLDLGSCIMSKLSVTKAFN
jgi:hypothetical protein